MDASWHCKNFVLLVRQFHLASGTCEEDFEGHSLKKGGEAIRAHYPNCRGAFIQEESAVQVYIYGLRLIQRLKYRKYPGYPSSSQRQVVAPFQIASAGIDCNSPCNSTIQCSSVNH